MSNCFANRIVAFQALMKLLEFPNERQPQTFSSEDHQLSAAMPLLLMLPSGTFEDALRALKDRRI